MEWWNSLSLPMQILWGVTLVASLIFVIQSIMTFIGADADSSDFSTGDSDFSGADGVDSDSDSGSNLLTFRNLVNFCMGFGWSAILLQQSIESVALLMIVAVCIVMSTSMILLSRPMTSLFLSPDTGGQETPIFKAAGEYLGVSAMFFPFLYILFLYRNALQGVGRTLLPLLAGVLELVIRTVASMTLPKHFGYNGVILSDVLAWVGACVMLVISYMIQMPKSIKKE